MPWIDLNGTDIYYVEAGSGPPLVFLHGNSSCAEAWFQQFEAFADRFRVIAYDSVNHGHSVNSPRDVEEPDRADELEQFLAALGIERPVLAGNSMGGNTILRWATRHPDAAAALIPSGSGVAAPGQTLPPQQPLDPDVLFLPTGDALTEGFKQSNRTMYERYLRIRSTATRLEAMRRPRRPAARTLEERAAMADRVGGIRSPMLIVVGALDRAVPAAERLHGLVPHSEYSVIPDAPHNVYYEAATAYNAAVSGFLAQTLLTASAR